MLILIEGIVVCFILLIVCVAFGYNCRDSYILYEVVQFSVL